MTGRKLLFSLLISRKSFLLNKNGKIIIEEKFWKFL
ncbi:unnamed protein product [Larinioides sclopetarius]|uniref:Uncharacterized protein n=1 Tax=Larinioides sclopetarius TaxID=280406 RepID=A0AAV1ZTZ1_9ARAC